MADSIYFFNSVSSSWHLLASLILVEDEEIFLAVEDGPFLDDGLDKGVDEIFLAVEDGSFLDVGLDKDEEEEEDNSAELSREADAAGFETNTPLRR